MRSGHRPGRVHRVWLLVVAVEADGLYEVPIVRCRGGRAVAGRPSWTRGRHSHPLLMGRRRDGFRLDGFRPPRRGASAPSDAVLTTDTARSRRWAASTSSAAPFRSISPKSSAWPRRPPSATRTPPASSCHRSQSRGTGETRSTLPAREGIMCRCRRLSQQPAICRTTPPSGASVRSEQARWSAPRAMHSLPGLTVPRYGPWQRAHALKRTTTSPSSFPQHSTNWSSPSTRSAVRLARKPPCEHSRARC